jgi:hypothetical protein
MLYITSYERELDPSIQSSCHPLEDILQPEITELSGKDRDSRFKPHHYFGKTSKHRISLLKVIFWENTNRFPSQITLLVPAPEGKAKFQCELLPAEFATAGLLL